MEYLKVNQANWDERAPLHAASPEYALDEFVSDPHRLSDVVRWADRDQVVLPDLRATPASLEAAFLDLTRSTDGVASRTLEVAR